MASASPRRTKRLSFIEGLPAQSHRRRSGRLWRPAFRNLPGADKCPGPISVKGRRTIWCHLSVVDARRLERATASRAAFQHRMLPAFPSWSALAIALVVIAPNIRMRPEAQRHASFSIMAVIPFVARKVYHHFTSERASHSTRSEKFRPSSFDRRAHPMGSDHRFSFQRQGSNRSSLRHGILKVLHSLTADFYP